MVSAAAKVVVASSNRVDDRAFMLLFSYGFCRQAMNVLRKVHQVTNNKNALFQYFFGGDIQMATTVWECSTWHNTCMVSTRVSKHERGQPEGYIIGSTWYLAPGTVAKPGVPGTMLPGSWYPPS